MRVRDTTALLFVSAEGEAAVAALHVVKQVTVDDPADATAGQVAGQGAQQGSDRCPGNSA